MAAQIAAGDVLEDLIDAFSEAERWLSRYALNASELQSVLGAGCKKPCKRCKAARRGRNGNRS